MGIKKYKPITPGQRGMTVSTFEEVTKTKPEKSLTKSMSKHAGRNSHGKITVRHRGGDHKKKYRIIDFKRNKDGIEGKITAIEYEDRKSTRLNSSHVVISYAVFCLKKKKSLMVIAHFR